jgi:hypothetical protein
MSARMPMDANDIAVWYLDEANGAQSFLNTAQGLNDLTTGTTIPVCGLSGLFGPCPTWTDQSSNYPLATASGLYNITADLSVSAWVNLRGWSYYAANNNSYKWTIAGLAKTTPDASRIALCYYPGSGSNVQSSMLYGSNQLLTITYPIARLPKEGWMHQAITYDHSTGLFSWYLNGLSIATGNTGGAYIAWGTLTGSWSIGGIYNESSMACKGSQICDVRIAAIARPQSHWREVYMRGMRLGSKHYPFHTTAAP